MILLLSLFASVWITLLGIIIGSAIVYYFLYLKNSTRSKEESILLMENIKRVCKLVTVEGEFVEIIAHNENKSILFNLFNFEKKAMVIVKAKAMVGFDLRKSQIEINENTKTIHISHFPQAEIISVEPEINYYDLQESIFNKFKTTDLSDLNKRTLEMFRSKIQESNLPIKAIEQADETLQTINKLIHLMGWQLKYDLKASLASSESPKLLM